MASERRLIEKAADLTDCATPGSFAIRTIVTGEKGKIQSRKYRIERWCRSSPAGRTAWTSFLKRAAPHVSLSKALYPLVMRDGRRMPRWVRVAMEMIQYIGREQLIKADYEAERALIEGLLRFARKGAHKHLRSHDSGAILPPQAWRDLEKSLQSRLIGLVRPCLERMVNPKRRPQKALAFSLWREYPVLIKLLALSIDDWHHGMRELLDRFVKDQSRLGRFLHRDLEKDSIVRVRENCSEPHSHGRTVTKLTLRGGKVLFYKPRSGEGEKLWADLLSWLGAIDFPIQMRSVAMLDRQTHCWAGEIQSEQCPSERAVKRYFVRVGVILCLGHLLRAVDCHRDNVVAAGEFPVVIDAETLWHPATKGGGISLRRTGMLPSRDKNGMINRSPFLGLGRGPHRVRLAGRLVKPSHYAAEICRGFDCTWRFLMNSEDRRRVFKHFRARAAGMARRQILRSTTDYVRILSSSLRPALLREGVDRYAFLALSCLRPGVTPEICLKEVEQLNRLDIPRFVTRRRCRSLALTEEGLARCHEAIANAFSRPVSCRQFA